MGRISLSNQVIKESVKEETVKRKLLPSLSKKEWIILSSTSFVLISIGIIIGFFIFNKPNTVDPLTILQTDLNNKLIATSKQLDKIEDEDLYKVVMEKKGKKIEQIKEQIELINQFKLKQSNEVQSFILNKKDELKQKEILYHR